MKDPLQAEATPYEVLRLERDARAAEVNRPFRTGVAERWAPMSKLTEALKELQEPSSRALVDLFVYDAAALGRFSPCRFAPYFASQCAR